MKSKLGLFIVTIIFCLLFFLLSFNNYFIYLDNNVAYASTKVKYNESNTSMNNFNYNNNSNKEFNDSYNNKALSITIKSEKFKYYNGDILTIFGNVYDNNLNLTKTVLYITPIFTESSFFHQNKKPVILQKTTIPVIDGSYNFTQYLDKPGFYNISVSDKDDNNNVSFVIEAKNKILSSTFILIYFTIGLLFLYGIVTWTAVRIKITNKNDKKQTTGSRFYNSLCDLLRRLAVKIRIINKGNEQLITPMNSTSSQEKDEDGSAENDDESKTAAKFKYEIFRFFILSAISILPLISFVVMDVEVGKFSPIGLVMQNTQTTTDIQQDTRNVQWVINIGGSALDNYSSGVTIPFYVFAFGWLGGYLRYLHKTVTKILSMHKDLIELNTNLWLYNRLKKLYRSVYKYEINILPLFLYSSFEELSEILLAPLLAIAVWLLLRIGTTTDIFTASLISFSVGLITKDVVYRIIEFSRNTIGQQSKRASETMGEPTPGTH